MTIEINSNTTLGDVIQAFTNYYPYLKMEFFKKHHHWQEESSSNEILTHSYLVNSFTNVDNNHFIIFHYWQKTGVVEQDFYTKYGLNIQIYRRQGDQWVQTTGTDELSLEEQNEIGRKATEDLLHGSGRIFEREKLL
jgi:hypothetical protein